MTGRILLFLLLAVVIYMVWRSRRPRANRPSATASEQRTPQAMVSCATCGLHVPRQEALLLGDRFFCCEEHRRQPPPA